MIRIQVKKDNQKFKQITFKGHANYEERGKDIVCAAASATYGCTVNAILSLNSHTIQINSSEDIQIIDVLEYDEVTEKLLENMITCLKSIEKKYPKNIKIR